jgi:glycosyltransferase involved in cell wall biosynthesis
VVQAVLFPATLHAAAAAALVNDRPRLVTSEQNTTNRRRKSILRPLDQWMYSRFDAIPCASRAIEESLVEWLPEIAGRASVIPNAIDLGRFQNAPALARSVIGVPDNVPAIIFVARFEEQKDHETLLRSLLRLNDAHLILAGDGPLRSSVEKLASFLGIRARVHFLGRRPDVPSLLKAADVYVQSSHWEGFGIAAVEAMAAGLPVIASDVPGLADVVRDAGLLLPPGDFAALGEAIRSVLESQGLRHELEKKSRQRAQQFSIQKCASGYLALYEAVLREKPHAN